MPAAITTQPDRRGETRRLSSLQGHSDRVLERGDAPTATRFRRPFDKTPRSGTTTQAHAISPLLANVYLHEVLDVWFEQEVRPRLDGSASLIRYADDATMVFAREADARRVLTVLAKRFAKYGLTLHPEKTKLIDFRRPTGNGDGPGSFDVLGFTHFWGRSQKGNWVVQRKTSRSRFGRALQRVTDWCRKGRHLSVSEQHKTLVAKVRGHYSYFGKHSAEENA
jgi:hypothetical protein